jgi:hypothetical protein
MSNGGSKMLAEACELLTKRLSFEELLAKLSPKDRINAQKRIAALEAAAGPALIELWRRLACALMTLAPHAAKLVGKQTMQFYVADGKYRMQVFALEDLQDANLTIYCQDVLKDAVEAGLLSPSGYADAAGNVPQTMQHGIVGSAEVLHIDALDRGSLNPAIHFKDMVGWNRTALRITLPPTASPAQVTAAELLCAIAAMRFARPADGTDRPPG